MPWQFFFSLHFRPFQHSLLRSYARELKKNNGVSPYLGSYLREKIKEMYSRRSSLGQSCCGCFVYLFDVHISWENLDVHFCSSLFASWHWQCTKYKCMYALLKLEFLFPWNNFRAFYSHIYQINEATPAQVLMPAHALIPALRRPRRRHFPMKRLPKTSPLAQQHHPRLHLCHRSRTAQKWPKSRTPAPCLALRRAPLKRCLQAMNRSKPPSSSTGGARWTWTPWHHNSPTQWRMSSRLHLIRKYAVLT